MRVILILYTARWPYEEKELGRRNTSNKNISDIQRTMNKSKKKREKEINK